MISPLVGVWHAERGGWLPRRDALPIMSWATCVTLPGGTRKGTIYDPRSHPGQWEFLSAYGSEHWRELVIVGPTQDGKTVCTVIVPMLHRLLERREDVVYGLPDELAGQRQWREKVIPVMRLSGLEHHMPTSGQGSKEGSRVTVMQFNDGGLLTWMGGGGKNESAQSSVSAPLIVADEVDSMKPGILEKIQRRADAYDNAIGWSVHHARRIYTSTIKKDDGTSKILGILFQSTDARLHFQCQYCKRFQLLSWERVKYDATDDLTAFDSARMGCEHCGIAWTDDDRKAALRVHRLVMRGQVVSEQGEVTGETPRSLIWGLLWTALDSPLRHLGQLCVWHRRALEARERGDHEPARQFWRDQLCIPYTGDIEDMESGVEITWRSLLVKSQQATWGVAIHTDDRAEGRKHTYSRHVAQPPADAAFTVAGVDVQGDRVYVSLSAYGLDGTSYDCAWAYWYAREDQAPWNKGELFTLLDAVNIWLRTVTEPLPLVLVGLDVGDWAESLMQWLRSRRDGVWKATKGASRSMKDEPGDIDGLVHMRDGLLLLDTDNLRELIHGAYRRPNGVTGSIHLPSGLSNTGTNTAYLKHICSERMVLDLKTRKVRLQQGPGRWDWQDCRRMAHAMALLHMKSLGRRRGNRKYGAIRESA